MTMKNNIFLMITYFLCIFSIQSPDYSHAPGKEPCAHISMYLCCDSASNIASLPPAMPGICKTHSLLLYLISSDLTSFRSSTCLLLPSFGTQQPCLLCLQDPSSPQAFLATLPLGPTQAGIPDFGSSLTTKLNKHKNNVENWQKAAKCLFCQVVSQKQEIASIITTFL